MMTSAEVRADKAARDAAHELRPDEQRDLTAARRERDEAAAAANDAGYAFITQRTDSLERAYREARATHEAAIRRAAEVDERIRRARATRVAAVRREWQALVAAREADMRDRRLAGPTTKVRVFGQSGESLRT